MAVVVSIARGHDASYPFKTIGAAEGPTITAERGAGYYLSAVEKGRGSRRGAASATSTRGWLASTATRRARAPDAGQASWLPRRPTRSHPAATQRQTTLSHTPPSCASAASRPDTEDLRERH